MLPEKTEGKEFQEYLSNLIKDEKYRHVNYRKTVDHAKELAVHAWGEKPVDILDKARPREDEAVKQYRIDSWEPITQSDFDKAIYILQKGFNSKLFSINFPPQPGGVKLSEEESLEYYTRKIFPLFDDVFNLFSEVLLKQSIADPNGVITIVPTVYNLPQSELQSPNIVIFKSEQVYDKKDGVYFVLLDQNTVKLKNREGAILHIITVNSIVTYEEIETRDADKRFIEVARFDHNFGILPAWHLGGVPDSRAYPYSYISFFNAAVPYWNKAVRLESDLDGALVNHLHPQKWEMTLDCEHVENGQQCQGGKIYVEKIGKSVPCTKCHGSGKISVKSPFDVYQINTDKLATMEGKTPMIPPAGYITVPTEIITVLDGKIKQNLEKGLSAICMDVVNKIGLDQSGKAKEIDRTELNTFMTKVFDYMFDNHIPNVFYFINLYRYGVLLGKRVDEYLPTISKPTSFDVLTIQDVTEELAKAKENNSSPVYLEALERDLIDKRFSTNEEIRTRATLCIDLDPFPSRSIEDKTMMKLNQTVSNEDLVISDNIVKFVKMALEEHPDFPEMEMNDQNDILLGYAKDLIKNNETQVADLVPALPGGTTQRLPKSTGNTDNSQLNDGGRIRQ
jgi:hypothetical protein